jgi:uncharacterized protein (DUF58 family)
VRRKQTVSAGPISLGLRQVYIIPSWRGAGWLGLVVLLGLTAYVYSNNLVYWLCFSLFAAFIVSAVHGVQSLLGLSLEFVQAQPVFAGERAVFALRVRNATRHARWGVRLQFRDWAESEQVLDLAAGETVLAYLSVNAQRRGWLDSPRLQLFSRYPFGWYRVWSLPPLSGQVLIYPQPAAPGLPFSSSARVDDPGAQQQSGDEFYGLRAYQPGDALRRIHWRSLAKARGLYSKQYAGAGVQQELWLDYAQTPGQNVEQRLSQLCRWVLEADQAGLRYGLISPAHKFEPDNGSAHRLKCLQHLALFAGHS